MLCGIALAQEVYVKYVTINRKEEKTLLVQCMNALYGSMIASVLFYKKLVASLKLNGFRLNPYNPCVANTVIESVVLMICFHVEDCKISHRSSLVVNDMIGWLKKDYEVLFIDGLGAMKVNCGTIHNYLGMMLDFLRKGEVHISMVKYLKDLWDTFVKAQVRFNRGTVEVRNSKSKSQLTAAPGNLFVVNKTSQKPLSDKQREVFHSCVAKALYFAK